ncbi:hypothetical protein [Photobacterium galatheae]|uniref:hypothetical protein n=1 Tax=Photobacterium galatheae TaxID=1654360 RepID=UPI000B203CED|nr:hypothetical protein [Photobacterium galatheae]
MFSTLFQKEKSAIYLGSLAVAPNGKINQLEQWFRMADHQLEDEMKAKLEEIFCLQPAASVAHFQKNDLILDVVIVNLRNGHYGDIRTSDIYLPVFIRPKIKLVSRLSYAGTQQTKETFEVSQTVPWSVYFKKVFSFRGLFGFGSLFSEHEMEILLMQGCLTLLDKMRKRV